MIVNIVTQFGLQSCRHRKDCDRLWRFGLSNFPCGVVERLVNADCLVIEVEIIQRQRQDFPSTKARRPRHGEQRLEWFWCYLNYLRSLPSGKEGSWLGRVGTELDVSESDPWEIHSTPFG